MDKNISYFPCESVFGHNSSFICWIIDFYIVHIVHHPYSVHTFYNQLSTNHESIQCIKKLCHFWINTLYLYQHLLYSILSTIILVECQGHILSVFICWNALGLDLTSMADLLRSCSASVPKNKQ